jgi:glycosyltransferase involved in cell wall biosynthesis
VAEPRPVVCLSSQPWHDPLRTNKHNIMERLAATRPVVWADIDYVSPLADVARFWRPRVERAGGVTVLEFYAPSATRRLAHGNPLRTFACFDLRVHALRAWLARARLPDPIVWVYHPGYGDLPARLPSQLVVYDCVDDYTTFPEFRGAEAWIGAREARLAAAADLVFFSAPTLHADKARLAPGRAHLVPNVGDIEHFARASAPETPVAAELERLPRPIVGFIGVVSDYKVDVVALAALARARPTWSVVVVGPVGVADPGTSVASLAALPNVHLLGRRPFAELPSFLKGFDVALLPYHTGPATRGVFPLKFFEYLVSGCPVVMTDLPALAEHAHLVEVARTPGGLALACEAALRSGDVARARRVAAAVGHGWSDRVAALLAHIDAGLEARQRVSRAGTSFGKRRVAR